MIADAPGSSGLALAVLGGFSAVVILAGLGLALWLTRGQLLTGRPKRRGLHRAAPAREEQVIIMSTEYVCEIALSAKDGQAIPIDVVVGSEIFDILAEHTAADPAIPFTVTSMTISPVSPGQ